VFLLEARKKRSGIGKTARGTNLIDELTNWQINKL